ncbi:MAG: class I SAM-dependent methyltransferase, partial [Acidobacteriota bacterium]
SRQQAWPNPPSSNDRDGRAEKAAPRAKKTPPAIEDFLGVPTRDLEAWAELWTHDLPFPVQHGGGVSGRFAGLLKRLTRPLVRSFLGDLLDRQRVFNLITIETLIQQRDILNTKVAEHESRAHVLDVRTTQGFEDVMRHNDALFARVDQKLDRYRREAKDLWHQLGALLAAQQTNEAQRSSQEPQSEAPGAVGGSALDPSSAISALEEQAYLDLELKFRGSEEDIASRVEVYRPHLEGRETALDLGCGRGEALELFRDMGLEAEGVDASSEMVARCRDRGLRAEQGDLFQVLSGRPAGQLDLITSFHVIEHLPPSSVELLVRLCWRALAPGGLLILETPSPLSLAMSARDFWLDPTHRRPVHPGHLEVTYRQAGFEPVERLDLHPFAADSRLPEIDVAAVAPEQAQLADRVNRLRDVLDELLFSYRDFALLGHKPTGSAPDPAR